MPNKPIRTFTVEHIAGLSLYAIYRDATKRVWNGSAWETWNTSNFASYVQRYSERSPGVYELTISDGLQPAAVMLWMQEGDAPDFTADMHVRTM